MAHIDVLRAAATDAAGRHTHVFGHTHFSIDVVIDGVRFVQHPLGNPPERANGWQISTSHGNPFALVWASKQASGRTVTIAPRVVDAG